MERLGHFIHKGVDDKTWRPIALGKNEPKISHLFFVDDLFLFFEANVDQVRTIREILEIFGLASGHKVNARKTHVFFPKMLTSMMLLRSAVLLGLKQYMTWKLIWACLCSINK